MKKSFLVGVLLLASTLTVAQTNVRIRGTITVVDGNVLSVTSRDGRLVAKRVHALGPQVPSGHMAWDSMPDSLMTNANLTATAQVSGGSELTLKYKDGEQKILVTPATEYFTFVPGSRADLKPGETIFSGARVGNDGKYTTQRVAVSKDGVKPPQ